MLHTFGRPASAVAAACFLGLLHAACASSLAPAEGHARPTVWSARLPGAGNVFLLGSVHLGKQGTDLGPAVDWAWSDASELVLEVDLARYSAKQAADLADRYGRIPTPATLRDRVGPRTYEMLELYLATRGLPSAPFEHLQPWLVATAIAVAEFQALGYQPDHGVDRVLLERAGGVKTVAGLETLESQFAMLSGLPTDVQDLMLRDMLERSEDFAAEATGMMEAWRRGDDDALERIVFRQIDDPEFAGFYESILFQRNREMADRIAALAGDGKSRLVVVGVAHLLGDRGIPALLGARGFEVEKVRSP